jgi:hypothetical protein
LTFISIGLIAFTLLQNRDALKMSAEELRLSREEMKLIRLEYKKTAEAQSKQASLAEESNKYNAMKDLANRLEEELLHNLDVLKASVSSLEFHSYSPRNGEAETEVIELSRLIILGGNPIEVEVIDGLEVVEKINELFGDMFSVAEVVGKIDKGKVTEMIGRSSYLKCSSVVFETLHAITNLTISWSPELGFYEGEIISYNIKKKCHSVILGLEEELLSLRSLVKREPIILK